jgi:hypothetical protein
MPEDEAIQRAEKDKEEGKSPSVQAGEFVREEIHHVREGTHGAQSPQQAIAIGLSKARRAGVDLPPPGGEKSATTRQKAERDLRKGRSTHRRRPSGRRSRVVSGGLRREGQRAASRRSLSRHSRAVAKTRGKRARHQSALKAVRTKGKAEMRRAAAKAARTRARHRHAA